MREEKRFVSDLLARGWPPSEILHQYSDSERPEILDMITLILDEQRDREEEFGANG